MRGRIISVVVVLLLACCWGAAGARAASTGNLRNDKLLALPKSRQAQVLANSFRRGCVGVRAFPMGVTMTGKAKGTAYWSVGCKNGSSYVVQIPPNVKEPAVVVDCRVLEGTGKACFRKF
ncbi:MAG: hypothetical protein ACREE2_07430 [Stellaceae bacterium]